MLSRSLPTVYEELTRPHPGSPIMVFVDGGNSRPSVEHAGGLHQRTYCIVIPPQQDLLTKNDRCKKFVLLITVGLGEETPLAECRENFVRAEAWRSTNKRR